MRSTARDAVTLYERVAFPTVHDVKLFDRIELTSFDRFLDDIPKRRAN